MTPWRLIGVFLVGVGLGWFLRNFFVSQKTVPINSAVAPIIAREFLSIKEARSMRREIDNEKVTVKGRIFKDESGWFWLVESADVTPKNSLAIHLADWPFGASNNSWSRTVLVTGKYGALDANVGFDVISPIQLIEFPDAS